MAHRISTLIVAVSILAAISLAAPGDARAWCSSGGGMLPAGTTLGPNWTAVPCPPSAPSAPSVSGGNSSAPALEGAAAGLQGLAALLDIANQLGSMVNPTDAVGPAKNDPEAAGIRCRDENRKAIAEMQAGRFGNASTLFNAAALDCLAADTRGEYWDNMHNAAIADAEAAMDSGWRAEQRGDFATANNDYLRGVQAARTAGATDLANKLAGYNDQLAARAGTTVKPTSTVCSNVNGQTICR